MSQFRGFVFIIKCIAFLIAMIISERIRQKESHASPR
jgi:hypothetical protein